MSAWGIRDLPSGNQKPVWANTVNVYGVSVNEVGAAGSISTSHAGWVQVTTGKGYLTDVQIDDGGDGYPESGYLNIVGGGGSGANASYTTTANVIDTIVVNTVGAGYDNASNMTVTAIGANGNAAVFTAVLGGRAGRRLTEVLVAFSSITDDGTGNTYFVGV